MSQAAVEVVGGERFAATLADAIDQLDQLAPMHAAVGAIIVQAAGPLAPRETGRLAAATTATAAAHQTIVRNPTPYAIPVHAGNRGRPAQPWIDQAATRTEAAQLAAADHHVQAILDTIEGV